jgi:hypothetical protein
MIDEDLDVCVYIYELDFLTKYSRCSSGGEEEEEEEERNKKKENKTFGCKRKKNDDIGSGLRIGAEEGSGAARREAAAALLLQGLEDTKLGSGLGSSRERERESAGLR